MPAADGKSAAEPAPGDPPAPPRVADSGPEPSAAEAPPLLAAAARAVADPSLWYLAAAGALYAGLLLALVTVADIAVLERAETEPWTFLWLQLLDDGILTGVALLFGLLRYPGSWEALGFRAVRRRWWAIGAATGLAAAGLAWGVSAALEGWVSVPPHPVEAVLERATSLPDFLVVLAAVTVPVAVGEETFFRGYAYRLLRARFGMVAGVAATALLFALVHGLEPGAWVPILPVGVAFALLVERCGSLWPAVLAHAVVNGLAIVAG